MKTCFFGKDNSNCAYNNKTRQETCINDHKKKENDIRTFYAIKISPADEYTSIS